MNQGDYQCPYCGKGHDCDNEDVGDTSEVECRNGDCSKYFLVYKEPVIEYHVTKADCLNGSPHTYKKQTTSYGGFIPDKIENVCEVCGDKEEL